MTFSCVFVTFPCGLLGQVWYLIVSTPDLWLLTYFITCENTQVLRESITEDDEMSKNEPSCTPDRSLTHVRVFFVAHPIRISEILSWDRNFYLTLDVK